MARLRHTTGLRSTNPKYGREDARSRSVPCCKAPHRQPMHRQRRFVYQNIRNQQGFIFKFFSQVLRFRSDIHCFDCWRLDRDFTVTASLTVYNGNFNAIHHEGSKAFRNCMDASAIFTSYTRNLNPNFSGCRNRIFDFDIPALDLTSFEWTYVLPYARINFSFILPSI